MIADRLAVISPIRNAIVIDVSWRRWVTDIADPVSVAVLLKGVSQRAVVARVASGVFVCVSLIVENVWAVVDGINETVAVKINCVCWDDLVDSRRYASVSKQDLFFAVLIMIANVDPPVVAVTTVFPGAAAEVVETSVTDPLEDQVNGIEGVKHVTSISREQVSMISIEFHLGRDLEDAANDVRDRVSRARKDLPDEVEEPVVAKRDSDARPVFWMALSGDQYDQIQLTSIAENQIVDRLTKLPGVASVIIAGERRWRAAQAVAQDIGVTVQAVYMAKFHCLKHLRAIVARLEHEYGLDESDTPPDAPAT